MTLAPLRRTIFTPEHDAFREAVRAFLAAEAVPHVAAWEAAGMVDRAFWLRAAEQGLVGFEVPERHGGAGVTDFRFNAVLGEEIMRAGAIPDNFSLQNDIILPYLLALGTAEQHDRWLPGFSSGRLMFAIAMSEPGMGSDLRAMQTTARRDGDGWRISGAKTFVTSGIQADAVVVACRHREEDGVGGPMSLLVVDAQAEGFARGRKLHKIGHLAQDTAELFFDDVRAGPEQVLGEPGRGLQYLKANLPQERMSMAVMAVAACEAALDLTVAYCGERVAFGQAIGRHQAIRFALAELRTEVDIARIYLDRCLMALVEGELTGAQAAEAKLWTTELQGRVVDRCLQLHGGYGYMEEYPIARMWRDARVQRIYGGTSEIMKEIVGRAMGF